MSTRVRLVTPPPSLRLCPISPRARTLHVLGSAAADEVNLQHGSAEMDVLEKGEHYVRGAVRGTPAMLHACVQSLACAAPVLAHELIDIGAVYLGQPIKGQNVIKWRRIIDLPGYELIRGGLGSPLLPGTLLRVHTSPKRYPACGTTDWPASLVHVDDDFVVVNKPSGLPCMRHVSNAREEVASCASRGLGMPELEVCHRLDVWTTGLLVLSRSKAANRRFKALLENKVNAASVAATAAAAATMATAVAAAAAAAAATIATTAAKGSSQAAGPGSISNSASGVDASKSSSTGQGACGTSGIDCSNGNGNGVGLGASGGGADGVAALQEPTVRKVYRALTWRPVPLGRMQHYMYDGPFSDGPTGGADGVHVLAGGTLRNRGPRLLSHYAHGGPLPVVSGSVSASRAGGSSKGGDVGSVSGCEADIPGSEGMGVSGGTAVDVGGGALASVGRQGRWRMCVLQVLECRPAGPRAHVWLQRAGADGMHVSPPEQAGGASMGVRIGTDGASGLSPTCGTADSGFAECGGVAEGARAAGGSSDEAPASASDPAPTCLFESRVLLLTGRTHQIRAQFAAAGSPLVGDAMYAPIAGVLVDDTGVVSDAGLVARIEALPQLEGPLGLHAAELAWGHLSLTAPAPWS